MLVKILMLVMMPATKHELKNIGTIPNTSHGPLASTKELTKWDNYEFPGRNFAMHGLVPAHGVTAKGCNHVLVIPILEFHYPFQMRRSANYHHHVKKEHYFCP